MNWDHPIHSFDSNAEPQTPTRTPSNPVLGESFHTPKLESSFYDPRVTWNTADPYGSSPEFPKTPHRFHRAQATHVDGTHTTLVQQQQHHHHPQYSPVVSRKSGQFDLSRDPAAPGTEGEGEGASWFLPQEHGWPTGQNAEEEPSLLTKRSAASMQTPPPTSSSRRKLQSSIKANSTPYDARTPRAAAAAAAATTNHPETPSRVIGLSPDLFGVQGGSPSLFQIPGASTTTESSFLPQQQQQQHHQSVPWVQEPDHLPPGTMDMPDSSYGDNAFAAMSGQPNESFDDFDPLATPNLQTPQQNPVPRLPPSSSTAYLDIDHGAAVATSFFTSPRVPPTHDEDPAMFLSSPARRFGFQESEISPMAPRVQTRQPYHFQTEESERNKQEKEQRKLRRAKSAGRRAQESFRAEDSLPRPPQTVASKSTRPPPSITHSRNFSLQSSCASGPASGGVVGAGVRKSPTKSSSSPIKGSRPPVSRNSSSSFAAPMESVVLKIGKDGRAKTQMITQQQQQQPPRPDVRMAFAGEESSTENESDSDNDDDKPITSFSQNMSFNVPEITPVKSKSNTTRSSSRSRPHSKSSSYSSTVASSHSGRHSPWAASSRGSGRGVDVMQRDGWMHQRNRSSNPARGGSSRAPSTTDSDATQDEASYNEPDDESGGDAQHALMQVLKQRSRPHSSRRQTGYRSVGRSIPTPTTTTLPSSPPVYRGHQDIRPKETSSPAQPMDHHHHHHRAPPKPGRHSNPISGTRCVCNSKDNGGHLMIQCESCTHWLHTKCVGLDRQSLPAVYVCNYCAHTPKRGGHVREREPPSASAQLSSPLARKSFQHR